MNMGAKLHDLSLAHLATACLPAGSSILLYIYLYLYSRFSLKGERVDALATELAAKTRMGIARPFLQIDLREFLPFWAHGAVDSGVAHVTHLFSHPFMLVCALQDHRNPRTLSAARICRRC